MPARTEKPDRHCVTIPVTHEDIVQCFLYNSTGFPFLTDKGSTNLLRRLKVKGVPFDAVPVYGWYDMPRQCFMITLEHKSFEPVPFGQAPPVIDREVDHIYCDHEGKFIKCESEPLQGWRNLPSQL